MSKFTNYQLAAPVQPKMLIIDLADLELSFTRHGIKEQSLEKCKPSQATQALNAYKSQYLAGHT